jgi:hypothetical protein
MESTDAMLSTLFATVALEGLLKDGTSDFKELEEMASSIFDGLTGPPEIARLFSNRHKAAHEGKSPNNEAEHSLEIGVAWGVIHLAAIAAADSLTTVAAFLDHMRGRVMARRVADQLRAKGRADVAEAVERAACFFGKIDDAK